MPFWTTTKKVSLFLLLNSPSFYLLLYIFYLSLDTFLLCFVFSTSIIQAQIMLTKNAAFAWKHFGKKSYWFLLSALFFLTRILLYIFSFFERFERDFILPRIVVRSSCRWWKKWHKDRKILESYASWTFFSWISLKNFAY